MSHGSSVIGAGTVVRGGMEGEGSLDIHGRVEGDVSMSGEVTVGEAGAVLGSITAGSISVLGAVQGDLRASEAVLLERGARVVGDLSAPRVGIAGGALVRGTVRTEGEAVVAAAKRAVSPSANLKPAGFAPKPMAKVEPRPAPAPAREEPASEPPPARVREADVERRPPPPVLPSLGKGTKAKKKKGRDE